MTLNNNIEEQAGDLLSRSGGIIENVEDFIYLGSWIDGTERDIKVRKGKAWAALHQLRNIWNSKLSQKIKIRPEATFKCGQKSQIVRCRTCLRRLIVRQSAAKIVKLCGEIAANIH